MDQQVGSAIQRIEFHNERAHILGLSFLRTATTMFLRSTRSDWTVIELALRSIEQMVLRHKAEINLDDNTRRPRGPTDCVSCVNVSLLNSKTHKGSWIMRRITFVIAFLAGLTAPAFAQKAAIDAVNAKWTEFFNKGDFAGVASLYTEDATAFPPGSKMVKGRTAIGAMWKGMADQVSDPKLTTLDVKKLGRSAAREIGTFSLKTKEPTPKEVTGKYVVVWEKVGKDWKLAADIWNDGK